MKGNPGKRGLSILTQQASALLKSGVLIWG
jgi:hypothetical protein